MAEAIEHILNLGGGVTNELSIYRTIENINTVVLVLPALGVRASYYESLCVAFAQNGLHAVTVDWRGNGKSNIRPSYDVDFGYKDLIEDTVKVIFQLEKSFPQSRKIILGHSLGGQIGALAMAQHPLLIEQLFPVASCNVFYEGFGKQANKIKRMAKWIFPSLSTFFGHFPGNRLGFGGREARGVMKDWCNNALTGLYEPVGSDFNYEKTMSLATNPVHAVSLLGDDMAPKEAVDNLISKFESGKNNSHIIAQPEDFGVEKLDHFKWVKSPDFIVRYVKGKL